MESDRTTCGAFVDHWNWAGGKGLINQSTAQALTAACRRILEVQEGWRKLDITTLDVEGSLLKFNNLKSKEFKPQSLKDYENRFRRAHKSYLSYIGDPAGWSYSKRRKTLTGRPKAAKGIDRMQGKDSKDVPDTPSCDSSQTYEYPFRSEFLARLEMPRDATTSEMDRLIAWARTLAVDYKVPQ